MVTPEIKIPFDQDEMTVLDHYPGFMPGDQGLPIYKTPIQPVENIKMFLADEKPLWMPSSYEMLMFNGLLTFVGLSLLSIKRKI